MGYLYCPKLLTMLVVGILYPFTRHRPRSHPIVANVSICVRAGLPKPRLVPDNERIKDTKTLDYASPRLTQIHCYAHVPHSPYLNTRMPMLWLACQQVRHWHWCVFSTAYLSESLNLSLMLYYNLFFDYFFRRIDVKEIPSRRNIGNIQSTGFTFYYSS